MGKQISVTSPVLGLDDGGFQLFNKEWEYVRVFGVVTRGAKYTDHVTQMDLLKDDPAATEKIIQLVKNLPNTTGIRAILHQGVTIAGFGILDLHKITKKTTIPTIAVLTRNPNLEKIKHTLLTNVTEGEKRVGILETLPPPIFVEELGVALQVVGTSLARAVTIVKNSTAVGKIPEALRLAHMMGESYYAYKIH